MLPINNGVVTFPYGAKYKNGKTHLGVDYRAAIGTPVKAMVGGTVVHSGVHVFKKGWGFAFGKHIIIDNNKFADGTPGLWAIYAHLSECNVAVGDKVRKGQILGLSGNTGNSTAPHLHVGVSASRTWNPLKVVNPQKWIEA